MKKLMITAIMLGTGFIGQSVYGMKPQPITVQFKNETPQRLGVFSATKEKKTKSDSHITLYAEGTPDVINIYPDDISLIVTSESPVNNSYKHSITGKQFETFKKLGEINKIKIKQDQKGIYFETKNLPLESRSFLEILEKGAAERYKENIYLTPINK